MRLLLLLSCPCSKSYKDNHKQTLRSWQTFSQILVPKTRNNKRPSASSKSRSFAHNLKQTQNRCSVESQRRLRRTGWEMRQTPPSLPPPCIRWVTKGRAWLFHASCVKPCLLPPVRFTTGRGGLGTFQWRLKKQGGTADCEEIWESL